MWTNNIGAVKNSGVILSVISYHLPILGNQHLANELLGTLVSYKLWNTNRACFDKLRGLVTEVYWDELSRQLNADELFDSFKIILFSNYNDSFPNVTVKSKSLDISKPYINIELRELFRDRQRLEKKIKLHLKAYGKQYRNLRNWVVKLMGTPKKKYYLDKMAQTFSQLK